MHVVPRASTQALLSSSKGINQSAFSVALYHSFATKVSQQQCQNNSVRTTVSQQCHNNSVTKTMPQQQYQNNSVTTRVSQQQCHNNSATTVSKQQRHNNSVTTTMPQQYQNNSVTTTVSQQQCHNNSVTTTVPQQQCHNNSVTTSVTTTVPQQQCHNNSATTTVSQQCHNNSATTSVTTTVSQQQCHNNSAKTTVSQQQCHNNSVTTTVSQLKTCDFTGDTFKGFEVLQFSMSAKTTQLLSSGELCKLRYDTIPAKRASANVSFYTNSSKMTNFELWHSCRKWAIRSLCNMQPCVVCGLFFSAWLYWIFFCLLLIFQYSVRVFLIFEFTINTLVFLYISKGGNPLPQFHLLHIMIPNAMGSSAWFNIRNVDNMTRICRTVISLINI